MPPKKDPAVSQAPNLAAEQDAAKEIMETELLVSFLRSKLGRYQQQGEKLQAENFKLSDDLEAQKLNLRDINEFLTNELKARTATNAALEERVAQLSQRLEDVRKECEAEVARVAADGARQVAVATERVAELQRQCASGQEFLDKRGAQESELAALKEKLGRQAKDWESKVSALERQHLADKERWRREVAARIKETKMQMAQLADQHLEGTTKRTILENEAMVAELAYHSAQSARLMAANGQLRQEAADLRRQAHIAQRTVEGVARKNASLQRILKAILAKLREEGTGAAAAAVAAAAAGPDGRPAGSAGGAADGAGHPVGTPGRGGGAATPLLLVPPLGAVAEEGPEEVQQQKGPAPSARQLEQRQSPGLGDAAHGGQDAGGSWEDAGSGPGQPAEARAGLPAGPDGGGQLSQPAPLWGDGGAAGRHQRVAEALAQAGGGMPAAHLARGALEQMPLSAAAAAAAATGSAGAGAARGPLAVAVVVSELADRVAALQEELDATKQVLVEASGLVVQQKPEASPAVRPPPPGRVVEPPVALGREPPGSTIRKRPAAAAAGAGGGCSGGGAAHRGMPRALEDGVASFVLYAVQQLRRAPPPRPDLDAEESRGAEEREALWAAGGGGALAGAAGDAAIDGGTEPPGERLAQLLLDLLHSYNPQLCSPYLGITRPHQEAPQQQPPQEQRAQVRAQERTAWEGGGAPQSPTQAAGPSNRAALPAPLQLPPLGFQTQAPGPHSPAAAAGQLPGIEELLAAVISDSKPWGKKVTGTEAAPQPLQPSMFPKRIAAGGGGSGGAAGAGGGASPKATRLAVSPVRAGRR